jgi:uroporphyrinogen decarboxylase
LWRLEVNHWQRLEAAILGQSTDQVPVALWRHMPNDDLDPGKLAAYTVAFQKKWDCDLVKFMPSGTYGVEDWGAVTEYRGLWNGAREVMKPAVKHTGDWARLPDLDVRKGSYGRQNQALAAAAKELGGDVPILQTVFSPLTTARKLATEGLFADIRRSPDTVHKALALITDVTIRFALDAMAAGAHGVFLATQLASYRMLQESEYAAFGRAYDLKVLEALRGKAKFNMLHVHGEDIMFDLMADYPVEMINWHDRLTEPGLGKASQRFPRLLVGGINESRTLLEGSLADVENQVRDAIKQTGGRRLMIGPGCVLPIAASDERIATAVRAARSHS